MDGKIIVDEFITDISPIEDINNSIRRMTDGESIRSVVVF